MFSSIFSAVSEPCQRLANQHHSMDVGKVLHVADLERRVDDAEARIAELSIQQNRGSQTTQTAQKLGSVGLLAIRHKACSQNGMLVNVLSQLRLLVLPHCSVCAGLDEAS